jgi:hypothetical protein
MAEKRLLLEKAHAALPAGGALIVYESIIDDDRRENAFGLLMSLNMLIETPGGFDYTGADCMGDARGRVLDTPCRIRGPTDGDRHQVDALAPGHQAGNTSTIVSLRPLCVQETTVGRRFNL